MVKILASELMEKEIPKIEYLVEGIIPKNGLVYCFGSAGSFKTNFLLYTAICGVMGKKVLDIFDTKKFKTLWLDEENREIGMKDKICKLVMGMDAQGKELSNIELLISNGFNILNPLSIEHLKQEIDEFKPKLVVIDSIAKVFPLSERDEKDVRKIYAVLRPIIEEFGVSFILIHHSRKSNFMQFKKGLEDMSGSREFGAMADSIILLDDLGNGKFLFKQVKNRYDSKVYAENFEVSGDESEIHITYTGKAKDKYLDKTNACKEDILKWVDEKNIKEFKRKEAVDVMKGEGHKASAIDSALKSLKGNELEGEFGTYKIKVKI